MGEWSPVPRSLTCVAPIDRRVAVPQQEPHRPCNGGQPGGFQGLLPEKLLKSRTTCPETGLSKTGCPKHRPQCAGSPLLQARTVSVKTLRWKFALSSTNRIVIVEVSIADCSRDAIVRLHRVSAGPGSCFRARPADLSSISWPQNPTRTYARPSRVRRQRRGTASSCIDPPTPVSVGHPDILGKPLASGRLDPLEGAY